MRQTTDDMELSKYVERLRNGSPAGFPNDANSVTFARHLDAQDKLRHLRSEFVLPSVSSLKKQALDGSIPGKTFET